MIGANEKRVIEKGWFTISVGGGQPNVKISNSVSARIELTGHNKEIE
jgi:hypothetical protein